MWKKKSAKNKTKKASANGEAGWAVWYVFRNTFTSNLSEIFAAYPEVGKMSL